MDARRLVLGDWTPWLRDGIDLLRLAVLGGAVVFAVRGDLGAAAVLAVVGAVTLLARAVDLPRPYDLCVVVGMALQGYGEALHLYEDVGAFDDVVHVVLPLLGAPVVYIALARLDVVPDPKDDTHLRHYVGMFTVTAALGLALGGAWEVVEWYSDAWFGTKLSQSNGDTVGDLLRDGIGSLAGAALLLAWARFGWGSVRRVPGTNTREDVDA